MKDTGHNSEGALKFSSAHSARQRRKKEIVNWFAGWSGPAVKLFAKSVITFRCTMYSGNIV